MFLAALPASTRAIAVLDRTKEPGSTGEPLYSGRSSPRWPRRPRRLPALCFNAAGDRRPLRLSSKEFTPAMVKAVLDEAEKRRPKNHFTVGINDDVSHSSLEV
jgi:pyruvate-ferredoxin/flavodoxin oxidoreductase